MTSHSVLSKERAVVCLIFFSLTLGTDWCGCLIIQPHQHQDRRATKGKHHTHTYRFTAMRLDAVRQREQWFPKWIALGVESSTGDVWFPKIKTNEWIMINFARGFPSLLFADLLPEGMGNGKWCVMFYGYVNDVGVSIHFL